MHAQGSGVFIVNSEQFSHLFCVTFADFEQVDVCWDPVSIYSGFLPGLLFFSD